MAVDCPYFDSSNAIWSSIKVFKDVLFLVVMDMDLVMYILHTINLWNDGITDEVRLRKNDLMSLITKKI